MKKKLLPFAASAAILMGNGFPAAQQVDTKNMNVLFIAIDDLNDWVGCFGGNPQVKTPNFDKFHANGGMVMADAHAPSTVCCPSRTALLTGVHCYKTGVYGNKNKLKRDPKAKDLVTLPEYFSKHGYYTLSMGKIFHKHPVPGQKELDSGQWAFDEWHKTFPGVGPASKKRPVCGVPNLPEEKGYHRIGFDWGPTKVNDEKQMKDYKTAVWAAEQLNSRDFGGKPFFMAIGFSKPHLPWYVPQKYFDMYPLDSIKLPKTLADDLDDIVDKNGKPIFRKSTTWLRMEKYGKHKEAVRAYLATISFVDDCLGVLLDGLARSKYADNTIVVIWGDHGWHLGEKQHYGKCTLWQESCRVPLMIKVPGLTPKNKKCYGVVNLIDLYPTLVDLCGLPKNPKNDGRSFAELIRNPDMEWRYPTLTTYQRGNHRIYDGRYSYIVYSKKGGEELYDHKTDPMEWRNLANNPEYAAIKERLKKYVPKTNEPEAPRNEISGESKREMAKKRKRVE
ncbi:MAG: iduronate sulfatase [Lentisphaerae bacterium]|nr:MAG: iduronate sulfatase [Lentisphaerota bacterium]